MKPIRPYDALTQLSILACLIGAFLLVGHVAGQIREGSASAASLVCGVALLGLSLLFLVLADIRNRLRRIEQHLEADRDCRSGASET